MVIAKYLGINHNSVYIYYYFDIYSSIMASKGDFYYITTLYAYM